MRISFAAMKRVTVDRADTGDRLTFKAKHRFESYVFLIGREDGAQITVCGELALNDNEAADLLLKVDQGIIGDGDPLIDFVGRVSDLGELVRADRDSDITEDGTKAGKKLRVARA